MCQRLEVLVLPCYFDVFFVHCLEYRSIDRVLRDIQAKNRELIQERGLERGAFTVLMGVVLF